MIGKVDWALGGRKESFTTSSMNKTGHRYLEEAEEAQGMDNLCTSCVVYCCSCIKISHLQTVPFTFSIESFTLILKGKDYQIVFAGEKTETQRKAINCPKMLH